MHPYSSAYQGADSDLITDPTPPKYFSYPWLWLFLLLLALRVEATTALPEEGLPNLASALSSSPAPLASEQQIATLLQQSASVLTAAQPRQQAAALAVNKAHRLASQRGERWFSQFGRARINLGSNYRFKQFHGELALLVPLDESCSRPLIFSQLGIHYYDSQPVANIGLGRRHLIQNWLVGYNAFLDQHLKRPHSRLGVGAELWRDYLKFSGNGYFAVTGWKESKKVEGYQEKAASGFDLRAQGYWPSYPQLGAHLLFENYFGDQVALFDKQREDWQKNPLAATLGIHYTPVPLFTIGVDHKIGRKSKKETRLTLQFDYLLDLPWEYQIDPHKVAASRTLNIGKYDWVQRNNRLVLQYRQLAPISLRLPSSDQLVGFPEEKIPLAATVEARFGFKAINWNSEALTAAGGTIKHLGDTRYEVILPKKPGRYPLIGIAVDQQGNQSTAATTEITVKQPITLTLPRQLFGSPKGTVALKVDIEAHFGLKEITWDDKALTAAGGAVKTLEDGNYQITLPEAPGSYLLTGIAVDKQGNHSSAATTELVVSDVTLEVASPVFGTPGSKHEISLKAAASKGIKKIIWKGDEFVSDGGQIYEKSEKDQIWTIVLPKYEKNYLITFVAYDTAGNQSPPVPVQLNVKKEIPKVTIQGPEAKELPATWLSGETIELTASGGDGTYAWTTSDDKVVSIEDKKDGHCIVTINRTGAVTIKATSAGDTASYTELEAEQPLLQAMDNTLRNYLESEAYCKDKGGSLPDDQILKDILQVRLKEVESWARKTFEPVENKKFISWVKDEEPGKEGEGNWKRPGYDLATGKPYIQLEGAQELCTICQFNP